MRKADNMAIEKNIPITIATVSCTLPILPAMT